VPPVVGWCTPNVEDHIDSGLLPLPLLLVPSPPPQFTKIMEGNVQVPIVSVVLFYCFLI
jgi:hypothetical protein